MFKINSRVHFYEFEPIFSELKYASFCNVYNPLSVCQRALSREADASDIVYELRNASLVFDGHDAVIVLHGKPLRVKCETEHNGLGLGGDIRKTAYTGKCARALVGIYIPEPVNLDPAHETDIKTAIVVEIKLVCHVIDGVRADNSAEHLARCRESAYTSGFYGQGYLV